MENNRKFGRENHKKQNKNKKMWPISGRKKFGEKKGGAAILEVQYINIRSSRKERGNKGRKSNGSQYNFQELKGRSF